MLQVAQNRRDGVARRVTRERLTSGQHLAAVEPRRGAFDVGIPQVLFSGPFDTTNANYTISKDGKHFVIVEVDPLARPTQLQVVLHWADELKQQFAASPGAVR